MALLQQPPRWQRDAACLEHPELDWHTTTDPTNVAACRAVCDRCPVQYECLADALEVGPDVGMRAGLTGPERRELRL